MKTRYTFPRQVPPSRPKGFSVNNDCMIASLSVALDVPYEAAHQHAVDHGFNPKTGCHFWRLVALNFKQPIVNVLGRVLVSVYGKKTLCARIPKGYDGKPIVIESQVKAPTLGQFVADHPVGRFIIGVRGHALALVDGTVLDTASTGALYRVDEAWEVC